MSTSAVLLFPLVSNPQQEMSEPLVGALTETQVRDLLFGHTDVRDAMLFLIQYGPIMDPVQRSQREQILQTLIAHSNQLLAVETRRMANWTKFAVLTAAVAIVVSNAVALAVSLS